jgi:hypothetical protein
MTVPYLIATMRKTGKDGQYLRHLSSFLAGLEMQISPFEAYISLPGN